MEQSKKHWLKFYPADWRSDPLLRSCSLAARGLLIDLMGFMHEAEPYGHLLVNGVAPTEKQMARFLQVGLKGYLAALQELTSSNTLSVTADGVLYSRRMVRDRQKTLQDQENGRKGAAKSKALGVDPPPPALDAICQRLETRKEPPNGGPPVRSGKATQLPRDFALTEARKQAALTEGMPADQIAASFARFYEHFGNKSDRFKSWDDRWIRWCAEDVRRDTERQHRRQREQLLPPGFGKPDRFERASWYDPVRGQLRHAENGKQIPEYVEQDGKDLKNPASPRWTAEIAAFRAGSA